MHISYDKYFSVPVQGQVQRGLEKLEQNTFAKVYTFTEAGSLWRNLKEGYLFKDALEEFENEASLM